MLYVNMCVRRSAPRRTPHTRGLAGSRRAGNLLILLELLPGPSSQDLLTHLLSNGAAGFCSLEFLVSRQSSRRSNSLISDLVAFAFQVISSFTFLQIPPASHAIP